MIGPDCPPPQYAIGWKIGGKAPVFVTAHGRVFQTLKGAEVARVDEDARGLSAVLHCVVHLGRMQVWTTAHTEIVIGEAAVCCPSANVNNVAA